MGMKKKNQSGTVKVIAMWAVIIVMVYGIISAGSGQPTGGDCPHKIEGASDGELKIEYFGSKFCSYCWIQEPIFKKLVKQYPDNLTIEHYDVRRCREGVIKYSVTGTPTMVFNYKGEQEIARGFLDELDLRNILCKTIGICE